MIRKLVFILKVIWGLITALALALILTVKTLPVYSIIYLVIFLITILVYFRLKKREILTWSMFSCALFLFFQFVSLYLEQGYNIGGHRVTACIIAAAGLAPVMYYFFKIICQFADSILFRKINRNKLKRINVFFVVFFFIFIMWFIVFLAFYPGIFGIDVPEQMCEGDTLPYSTHHPIIHTLLLQASYKIGQKLGNCSLGIALGIIIQMLILAVVFSYVITYIYYDLEYQVYAVIASIFVALFPPISVTAITTTKDLIFSAFFVLFVVLCFQIEKSTSLLENKKTAAIFLISIIVCCLFRNNGIYVMIPTAIVCIYCIGKKQRNKVILIFIIGFAFYFLISGLLKYSTDAVSDGNNNEMLSLPFQQISRVYKYEYDKLSKAEKGEIEQDIPNVTDYNDYNADHVKNTASGNIDMKKFGRLYLKLMRKYPYRYFEAFCFNNYGYIIVDTSFDKIYGKGDQGMPVGYLYFYLWNHMDVERHSFIPSLYNYYVSLFSNNNIQKIPVLSVMFQYAIYCWICLFCFAYSLDKGDKRIIPGTLTVTLLLGTFLLGPRLMTRYVFPFMICSFFLPPFIREQKEKCL